MRTNNRPKEKSANDIMMTSMEEQSCQHMRSSIDGSRTHTLMYHHGSFQGAVKDARQDFSQRFIIVPYSSSCSATMSKQKFSTQWRTYLSPPKYTSVGELIGYTNADEAIEIMPLSVQIRKLELDFVVRERKARARKKQMEILEQQSSK
mmetsp:Transcript_33311/g.70078  ORF Transcript_33311/g.70078 Transcript_33311/m.70078 type:complete len:149 (+) Transcript_33311:233-679(+)|eukprot:CAMPEP_0172326184 /NCGR_PEP_ID=MMETSP1058-20130122/55805_1 /TAXON_ID=83371 /ORGANISM="Detonula confervacea, Strain CCMP 353" /LENGTH=148 /DNA_ID=CAMNT_0013042903 /DNA_START=436 /DNA_END=882 /DNA_ORIENTATION=-